ncbi:MAG TPA: tetratricopeptide repeat protein [Nitrosopumilaceae archaeon]|nr:tetratricopeptide repeat protein [Nitrosopumilaceae archaeon]
MLGSKTKISLLLILIIPTLIVPVFANDDSLILETDKVEYEIGDSMIISGFVEEKKMPVVALKIFDPNGGILSANQIDILEDNTFSKTIQLDSPFYDETGIYSITIDYGKLYAETTFEMVNENEESSILDDDLEFFFPEILAMFTDQEIYEDEDTVTIIGLVSEKDQDSVLIGIYDPFGTPTGFYFGEVDSDLEFSVSFLVTGGVNFKTEGTYSISAFYGDSEEYTNFEYVKKIETVEVEPIDDDKSDTENQTSEKEKQIDNKKSITAKEKTITQKESKESTQNKNLKPTKDKAPPKPKSENNLSVEDIELGIMLNQINLNCDNNEFVDTISYYDSMGPALIRLCKYADAIYYYDQSLISDPNNVDILTNKGSALAKMNFYEEAIIHYDSALAVEPNNFQALNNKANALSNLEKYDEAIQIYNKALITAPGNLVISNNLEKAQTKSNTIINDDSLQLEEPPQLEQEQNFVKSNNQESTNIFEQIGNILSSLFGFLP